MINHPSRTGVTKQMGHPLPDIKQATITQIHFFQKKIYSIFIRLSRLGFDEKPKVNHQCMALMNNQV